jgi:hypothetical protein
MVQQTVKQRAEMVTGRQLLFAQDQNLEQV